MLRDDQGDVLTILTAGHGSSHRDVAASISRE
jgi:hypothetical protein